MVKNKYRFESYLDIAYTKPAIVYSKNHGNSGELCHVHHKVQFLKFILFAYCAVYGQFVLIFIFMVMQNRQENIEWIEIFFDLVLIGSIGDN